MPKSRRPLDPAIEALARERLEGDEIILGWNDLRAGEVRVRLISEAMHRMCAESVRRSRRGAGCGRTLVFVRRDGGWEFRGAGGWIS